MDKCTHYQVTSTFEKGPYCCACGTPLVGVFTPIDRNTPAGALLYAMKIAANGIKENT